MEKGQRVEELKGLKGMKGMKGFDISIILYLNI
jgi:hypothetical protein